MKIKIYVSVVGDEDLGITDIHFTPEEARTTVLRKLRSYHTYWQISTKIIEVTDDCILKDGDKPDLYCELGSL